MIRFVEPTYLPLRLAIGGGGYVFPRLYVFLAEVELSVIDELSDVFLVALAADDQHVVVFDNDIVFKPLDYCHMAFGQLESLQS